MKRGHGFTIVELLIVIVVIGILAAITVVAYIGISNQAADAALKSDLRQMAKQVQLYIAEHDDLPRSATFQGLGVKVTKSAYGVLWTNSDGTSSSNAMYCSPTSSTSSFLIGATSR